MKIVWLGKKRSLGFFIAVFALILTLAVANVCAPAVYAASAKKRSLPVYSVERTDKKIAISFDCAWGVEHTDELLKIMDEYDVKCTFFAVQFWVEKYPEYVEKIVSHGHEMGTHSKTHPKMSTLSEGQMREELTSSVAAIERVTAKISERKVDLFRPPFGDYNDRLIDVAKEEGLFSVQWDVDSLDWKGLLGQEIALRVINGVKNGSIILCHNNGEHTAEALPMIFSTLQNRGYEFVPIGELIYREDYAIRSDGRQIKTG